MHANTFSHVYVSVCVIAGNGFDRHMFALKCLAQSEFLSMPIFQDPSYIQLNTIVLSTSTLVADALLLGGFAPVNPDSYGMGYSVKDDMIGQF